MQPSNIYDFIKQEEAKYQSPVSVIDGWEWKMCDHVKTSILYKNGQLLTGNSDNKPIKNIILPILNLRYRAEDIDVKNIDLYVDDADKYHLSFLIKKYHDEVFVVENDIDTFIDREKEEHIDLGGVLLKEPKNAVPDIVRLQDIAFCNQNDMLSSPIGILHIYSPDQLKEMEKYGWERIDEVIDLAGRDRGDIVGRDIKVYEVHGVLPESYLTDSYDSSKKYVRQMHIVSFYKDDSGSRNGISLFKGKQAENIFKLYKQDDIYNRALGRGGIEELFEPQVWTNYTEIQKKNLLDAASKIIIQTDDETLAARHPSGLKNMKNLEMITVAEGRRVGQIDTFPRNFNLFDKWQEELALHARQTGGAQEAIMGDQPPANTPFRSVELQSTESHSLHNYRIGKHAKFLEEIYRDWFIPYIIKQIVKGKKFLASLDLEDMQFVAERLSLNKTNEYKKNIILDGGTVDNAAADEFQQTVKQDFMKKGDKHFIEILKDEFKNEPISVRINISNKQKNLAQWVDKLVNVFRQILAAPQVLQNPALAKIFNEILEISGLSPVDFSGLTQPAMAQPAMAQPAMAQPAMAQPAMAQ